MAVRPFAGGECAHDAIMEVRQADPATGGQSLKTQKKPLRAINTHTTLPRGKHPEPHGARKLTS